MKKIWLSDRRRKTTVKILQPTLALAAEKTDCTFWQVAATIVPADYRIMPIVGANSLDDVIHGVMMSEENFMKCASIFMWFISANLLPQLSDYIRKIRAVSDAPVIVFVEDTISNDEKALRAAGVSVFLMPNETREIFTIIHRCLDHFKHTKKFLFS